VLEAIVPPPVEDVPEIAVRAQYGPGVVGGKRVPGYREEEGVPPDSRTETYAALRLHVSNWRWAGVPFYLRTGKRLARKVTEIVVTLKPVPHVALQSTGSVGVQQNQIILTVQPDEGVSVSVAAKIPGPTMRIRPVYMEFRYGTSFLSESPEAYERLILDAMRGDATLFTRNDEIEALWAIVDPILDAWREDTTSPIPQYPAGSSGPPEADRLLQDGRTWRRL
jgi:glucose-6-phosphate 1-dehydrogenase